MRRLENGAPLRAAMKAAELDISHLAAATKSVDPTGEGLSRALVGFIAGQGKTAREECSDHAAGLIAAALNKQVGDLFEEPSIFLTSESTYTRRSKIPGRRRQLPAQLMKQHELADFLRKSPSWIDEQIRQAATRGETWPGLFYVGRSRRFDPHAVLEALQEHRQPAA
ncbi:hypothetical protein AB0D59_01050 [Streptomyces sp. NPDC048417]|uniref:hypothetical protein n=1 Tax=Streptomyces sp. NPDC048417 TaxID=3155387 RepID=UPI00343FEA5E